MIRFEVVFGTAPTAGAEAPGRVNLIGEHTDYHRGLVLPAAVSLRTRAWLRYRDDDQVRGRSRERGTAEAALADPASGEWLDYLRGVARVLRETGRIPPRGFDALVASELPEGAGLASSAALEVAVALALAAAAGAPFRASERRELARLCQRAEAEFVGVPCGIMDPFAVACAEPGAALLLDCAELRAEPVRLPVELEILVVDTGVRRELRDGAYAKRRGECDAALEAARAALARPLASLSEIREAELCSLEAALPAVELRRVRHVVRENARVRGFAAAVARGDLARAGAVLHASHESLARDYEVSWPEADYLVAASRELAGAIGARMTGAGWGGCTLHLVHARAAREVERSLGSSFERRFGRRPRSWLLSPSRAASVLEPFPS